MDIQFFVGEGMKGGWRREKRVEEEEERTTLLENVTDHTIT